MDNIIELRKRRAKIDAILHEMAMCGHFESAACEEQTIGYLAKCAARILDVCGYTVTATSTASTPDAPEDYTATGEGA